MMEVTRSNAIDTNYKDLNERERQRHFVVNIAIVDKTSTHPLPILYVLKRDLWDAELALPKQHLDGFVNKNPLMPLGPLISIDRYYKRLYLQGEITVVYHHLIMFTAPSPGVLGTSLQEMVSVNAVQTLIDALRCQPIRPSNIVESSQRNLQCICASQTDHRLQQKTIEGVLLKPSSNGTNDIGFHWSRASHWLFEVQT